MPTSPTALRFPEVVFYGDSVTTGWRGTTSPRSRWTSLVSDELGWREVNLAIDGMAFMRRRGPRPSIDQACTDDAEDTTLLDTAVRLAPDAVVVSLGANDAMLLEGNEQFVRASIERDLGRLRDELPGRPVVIAPYFAWSHLPPKAGQIINWQRTTAEDFGHHFTDALLTPIEAAPEMLCDDGMHPNDRGHRALADSILPVLAPLELS